MVDNFWTLVNDDKADDSFELKVTETLPHLTVGFYTSKVTQDQLLMNKTKSAESKVSEFSKQELVHKNSVNEDLKLETSSIKSRLSGGKRSKAMVKYIDTQISHIRDEHN